jgi:hypothetical protein
MGHPPKSARGVSRGVAGARKDEIIFAIKHKFVDECAQCH